MSLKAVHVAFIALATALACWFAVWAFEGYSAGSGGGYLALAGGAAVLAVALVAYGMWFLKKMKGVSNL
jgi:hypothetical protein